MPAAKKTAVRLIGILYLCTLISCVEEPQIIILDVEENPTETTFLMNFDFLQEVQDPIDSGSNWGLSYLAIQNWVPILTDTLDVPLSAINGLIGREPEYKSGISRWIYEYDFAFDGARYQARMEALVTSQGTGWEMFITRDLVFEEFKWFTGKTAADGLSGEWQVNKSWNDPVNFLEIEWFKSEADQISNFIYRIKDSRIPERSDFIIFENDPSAEFNIKYDIYDSSLDNLTEVEWNNGNKTGRIRDIVIFDNVDFQCWDGNLKNIDCR